MNIQWEYDLVEKPFCEQLKAMGWQWLQGDTDAPELTERESFREVLLKERLAAALRKLNRRDGQPWLDNARIARTIRDLEQAAGRRLMDVNQLAAEILLRGTVVEGLSDWDHGRQQPVRFIDFEHPAHNDFLVINQFKVELTSGRGHVIPDAVLFVNGIPLVVAEFKSPGIQNPLQEAIDQLLRYSNQRRELFPMLYTENEGVERLFHTNQLLIASDFFEARAATIGAPPEAYLEWADTSPVPLSTVAEELGILTATPELEEAAQELATLGGPSRPSAPARRSSSARRNSVRQRCAARAARCTASRSSSPACCDPPTCSTSSATLWSFGRWMARPARWWRATSRSAPYTGRSPACRKAALALRAPPATSAAASPGTPWVPGRA